MGSDVDCYCHSYLEKRQTIFEVLDMTLISTNVDVDHCIGQHWYSLMDIRSYPIPQ